MTHLPTGIGNAPKEHVTWSLRYDTGCHTLLGNHWQCSQCFHAQGGSSPDNHLVFFLFCVNCSVLQPHILCVWAQAGLGAGTQFLLHSQVLNLAPLLPELTPMGQCQASTWCTSPERRKCQRGPGTSHSTRQTASHLVSATGRPCGGG